ncbi:sporulation protein YjcZ [Paenibacillus bouchesdurhonensis]
MGNINPCGPGPVIPGSFWTSTGTILVLYILLVIILRAPLY